jgi:hypothetical protein
MLFAKIRPLYFFVAFSVGLLACYIMTPPPNVVVRFPSPYNAGKVVYKDKGQSCYTFSADQVECPTDALPQPLSEDFRQRTPSDNHASAGR